MLFSLCSCFFLSYPKIKKAEFPFKLVYEKDGEEITVEDTLICEFDGFGADEGQGIYRKWKSHYASGNEKILFHYAENTESVGHFRESALTQEIYYTPGSPDYYMGDYKYYVTFDHNIPEASFSETYEDGASSDGGLVEADLLLERFNIKLISWEIAPPIENSFR